MTDFATLNRALCQLLLVRRSRLNVEDIKAIYLSLNLKKIPMVHIAGTNGKGSCSVKISEALTQSGYRCGRYTSPHIATFRERIVIDGQMISEEEVVEILPDLLGRKEELTCFEVMTLLALSYFSIKEVDVAVIEVGLGGRLDATNCIDPFLTLITSISYDHQHLLGNTLEKIAAEKAGIIKGGIPVVLGPTVVQKSPLKKAREKKAPVLFVKGDFESYDVENQAIAKTALTELQKHFNLKEEAIQKALLARPPSRFEKVHYQNREILLDISHNEAGLKFLFKQILREHTNQKRIIFYSVAKRHDQKIATEIIQEHADQLYILDMDHPWLSKPQELLDCADPNRPKPEVVSEQKILEKILSLDPKALFVFTGSSFIMKPIREFLGFKDEEDLYPIHNGSFNFSEPKAN